MTQGKTVEPFERIFCALDVPGPVQALALAARLRGHVGGVKLGLEFFCAAGPMGIAAVAEVGLPIFLDLKLHDIPNTVVGAIRAALHLRPAFITVHAAGGTAMLRAAMAAARETSPATRVLAVTVLTSLDDADLALVGQTPPARDLALRLAALAQAAGLDGVVCSPAEVAAIRAQSGSGFTLMVPGIRPAGTDVQDQKRVMSPAQAVAAGADYLVIGRPISAARDPVAAAIGIAQSMDA